MESEVYVKFQNVFLFLSDFLFLKKSWRPKYLQKPCISFKGWGVGVCITVGKATQTHHSFMSVALMEWMFSLAKEIRLGPLSSGGMYRKANYKVAPVKSCLLLFSAAKTRTMPLLSPVFLSNLMRKINQKTQPTTQHATTLVELETERLRELRSLF